MEKWLDAYQIFVVKGNLDLTSDKICKIKAETLVPFDLIFTNWPHIQNIAITLPTIFNESLLQDARQILTTGNIPLHIVFEENAKKLSIETKEKVTLTTEALTKLAETSLEPLITL